MRDTITIFGSYGALVVDRRSGAILSYDPVVEPGGNPEGEYSDIVRFDVNEARLHYGDEWPAMEALDIVLINFWTNTGAFIEHERETVAAIHAELAALNGD